jgi:phosphatidylserine/phosphatidylglycerophosphate/cardiolipin synthase-like enzyme
VRFIEMVLLIASLVILLGTNERRVPIGLLAGALCLNLIDREAIARKLSKQESELKQLQPAMAIPKLTEADERLSLQGRLEAVEHKHQSIADALQEMNAETLAREWMQPVLKPFEHRFSRLESAAEQFSETLPLFDALRTAPESLQLAHEKLINNENILEQLSRQYLTQETINQLIEHIGTIRPHTYELVWDMEASHNILIEALKNFQHRLILVNPWLSEYVFTTEIKRAFEDALNRPNSRIYIGWGYWKDISHVTSIKNESQRCKAKLELDRFKFKEISEQSSNNSNSTTWKYKALEWLSTLEKESSQRLKLKLLYTHQKYLVCDNEFTLIGSHNFLASSPADNHQWRSPDTEVGIRREHPTLAKVLSQEEFKDRLR